jgi:hypothetical protein
VVRVVDTECQWDTFRRAVDSRVARVPPLEALGGGHLAPHRRIGNRNVGSGAGNLTTAFLLFGAADEAARGLNLQRVRRTTSRSSPGGGRRPLADEGGRTTMQEALCEHERALLARPVRVHHADANRGAQWYKGKQQRAENVNLKRCELQQFGSGDPWGKSEIGECHSLRRRGWHCVNHNRSCPAAAVVAAGRGGRHRRRANVSILKGH